MKIFFLCHRLPFPPDRGGKIRPFNVIKHLGRTHEVTVASLSRSGREAEDGTGLKDYCQKRIIERMHQPMSVTRMIARLPTKTPSTMGYFAPLVLHGASIRNSPRPATTSF